MTSVEMTIIGSLMVKWLFPFIVRLKLGIKLAFASELITQFTRLDMSGGDKDALNVVDRYKLIPHVIAIVEGNPRIR